MKKLLAILLTGALLIAGCGTTKPATNTNSNSGSSTTSSTSSTTSKEPAYPTKSITMIAHTAAGGGADIFARQAGKILQNVLGKPVVIDNRSGGSGAVALQFAADSKPDGYTILAITDTMIITPLNNSVPKDLSNFKPLSRMLLDASVVYVKADSKWTADSMLEAIKKGDKNMKWGASQAGAPETILIENLIKKHNAKISPVLLGDGTKCVTGVLSGDIEASVAEVGEILPQLKAKQLKILFAADSKRIPYYQDVPTLVEKGFSDIYIDKFRGFAVPKDTPADVVKILEDAFKKVAEDPEYKKACEEKNQVPAYLNSADFTKFIADKTVIYKKAFNK